MALTPEDNIKLLDKNNTCYHSSYLKSSIIIVPKKKEPSTYEVTYRMVVGFRKISEQLEYWSYPLMRIESSQNFMEPNYSSH